jgi:hypothetical protein
MSHVISRIDRAIEALGDGAGMGVGKLGVVGTEGDRLPVLPVPQVSAAPDADAQTCFAVEERRKAPGCCGDTGSNRSGAQNRSRIMRPCSPAVTNTLLPATITSEA